MKSLLLLSSLLLLISNVFAGQDKGNGGDICENKMRNISNDIESWLISDNYIGIKLPSRITEVDYKEGMLEAVKKSLLSCSTDKILIGRAEKTCKNFQDKDGDTRIVCNFDRFLKTEEKEKYKLLHHEFAGVAEFESNNGNEASVYEISEQITDFLRKEEILKLGIKKRETLTNDTNNYLCSQEVRLRVFFFPLPVIKNIKIYGPAIGKGSSESEAKLNLKENLLKLRKECQEDGASHDIRAKCVDSEIECVSSK